MRTKLSVYNTTSAMLLQLVNIVVNFILPKVLITEYGSAVNGLILFIRQFIAYFSIVEGGLTLAAMYALYKPLADKDNKNINSIVSAANKFYNISGFLFSALVLILTFTMPLLKNNESLSPFVMAGLVLIIGTSGALDYFAIGKYKVLFTADQKSYVISLINAFAILLNSIIIVVLVKLHLDILLVQLFALGSFFIRSLLYALYAKFKYSYLDFKVPANTKALDKRWDALILNILGAVTMGTPIIAITFICGLKEASVYGIYNIVFAGVLALLSTFNNGLSASFGDLIVRKEIDIFQRAYIQYEYIYYGLLGWAYSCAAILVIGFMKIYTASIHDVNYIRPEVALLFVISGLLYNTKTPQGMLVISAGLYKETKRQTLLQALINLVVSFSLAPFFGIPGVLIGSVCSNLYRTIDLAFFIPRTLTKLSPMITIKRILRLFLLSAISIVVFLKYININSTSYLGWVVSAIFASLWCLFVFVIGNVIMERETTKLVISRIKFMLRKNAENRRNI